MMHYDKILLIDDESICNFVASKILERANLSPLIESFLNARAALTKIKSDNEPGLNNLILLDINMPGMNGWEFLEEFEKLPGSIIDRYTVIILTSSLDNRDVEKSQNYKSVKKFVSKPISIEKIRLDQ